MKRPVLWIFALVLSLAACSSGNGGYTPTGVLPFRNTGSGSSPIQHIIVMVQENRSFNELFGGTTINGITVSTTGMELIGQGKKAKCTAIPLAEVNLYSKYSLNHLYTAFKAAWAGGKACGFNKIPSLKGPEAKKPYVYVNPSQIQPYITLGSTYAMADKMFQTQGSGSFTAHQDLIRGGTEIDSTDSLIDDPNNGKIWGCDSYAGTKTSLVTTSLVFEPFKGPFPCTTAFPYYGVNYLTLRDLLDTAGVSWKYYVPQLAPGQPGALWNAFDVIWPVRNGAEWGTNVDWPEKKIFSDITYNELPAVSWVIPDEANSDHPGYKSDTGPSWVASVVNAVGESSYWNNTAIVVLWDDWGGFYDPVKPPPHDKQGGPGFRVPMIVVSAYARETSASQPGYVSETTYGFGSVVRYIEDNFNLGQLGTTDSTSNSISDMLDYSQYPRQFQTVGSKYSRAFFLRQKPSGLPVDTQ